MKQINSRFFRTAIWIYRFVPLIGLCIVVFGHGEVLFNVTIPHDLRAGCSQGHAMWLAMQSLAALVLGSGIFALTQFCGVSACLGSPIYSLEALEWLERDMRDWARRNKTGRVEQL